MDTAAALIARASALTAALDAARMEVGLRGKKIAAEQIKRVAGGDAKFSHWRKGRPGPKLAAGFEIEGEAVVLNPRPVGLWAFAEAGARPHTIPRRKSVRRTRRGTRVVNGVRLPAARADSDIRPWVHHPGFRPSWAPWDKTRTELLDMAPVVVTEAVAEAMS